MAGGVELYEPKDRPSSKFRARCILLEAIREHAPQVLEDLAGMPFRALRVDQGLAESAVDFWVSRWHLQTADRWFERAALRTIRHRAPSSDLASRRATA